MFKLKILNNPYSETSKTHEFNMTVYNNTSPEYL